MDKVKLQGLLNQVLKGELPKKTFLEAFITAAYQKTFLTTLRYRKEYFRNLPFNEVNDVVQGFFEKKVLKWSLEDYAQIFQNYENLDVFLFVVVRNFCKTYARLNSKRLEAMNEDLSNTNYKQRLYQEPKYEAKFDFPKLLQLLPKKDAEVLMYHASGYKYKEIAELLDFPSTEAVRMFASRARDKLRKTEYQNS